MASKGILLLTVVALRHGFVNAWGSPKSSATNHRITVRSSSASDTSVTDAPVMGGVSEFEDWFSNQAGASCRESVTHAAFGSLRGLKCTEETLAENTSILTVPKPLVLRTPYADDNWDAQLAQSLWSECLLGSKSDIYGYCALLTLGTPVTSSSSRPPSTAPNALRHWTESEKKILKDSESGRKLLALHEKQQALWKEKYKSISTSMSWEQFEWAMEVVHSRAFKGEFGLRPGRTLVAAGVPIVAAAAGWFGVLQDSDPDLVVLGVLALVAAIPTIFNALSPDKGDVVLLPLIDSANHLEGVDSSIEYDPLKGAFTLSAGPKCLVTEEENEKQLYISYGVKKDTELLLNYGFLPGVLCDDGQRRELAETYMGRN